MIYVGQKFTSYEQLQKALEEFEFANNVKFMKLKTSKLNKIEIPDGNEKLVYKAIIFQCIRGGPFVTRGKGLRNRSTEKQDCPAHIKLRISNDAQTLVVRSIGIEHNHEILERWVYFKDGIPRSVRRKLNLKKMFMRNIPYQMDGHENLYAALIEPKALEVLQQPAPPRKRRRVQNPEQEVEVAAESICIGEISTIENCSTSPIKQCCEENEQYSRENEQCVDQNGESPSQNEYCLTEDGLCPLEDVQSSIENEQCSTENGHCPTENGQCPTENGQCPTENEQCPTENEQCPTENEQCPTENEQCPTENGQCPTENGQCSTENEQYSSEIEYYSAENKWCSTEKKQYSLKKRCSAESEICSIENHCSPKTVSSLLETQKTILNTLNVMNENIQILNTNMVTLANTLNTLVDKVSNVSHIVLRKPPQK